MRVKGLEEDRAKQGCYKDYDRNPNGNLYVDIGQINGCLPLGEI